MRCLICIIVHIESSALLHYLGSPSFENDPKSTVAPHATAAFVLAIDDMIMPAAADVVSAHLMNGNAVLELHFSVYQVALVSACRGAAMGHATKEVSQCPLP